MFIVVVILAKHCSMLNRIMIFTNFVQQNNLHRQLFVEGTMAMLASMLAYKILPICHTFELFDHEWTH